MHFSLRKTIMLILRYRNWNAFFLACSYVFLLWLNERVVNLFWLGSAFKDKEQKQIAWIFFPPTTRIVCSLVLCIQTVRFNTNYILKVSYCCIIPEKSKMLVPEIQLYFCLSSFSKIYFNLVIHKSLSILCSEQHSHLFL